MFGWQTDKVMKEISKLDLPLRFAFKPNGRNEADRYAQRILLS